MARTEAELAADELAKARQAERDAATVYNQAKVTVRRMEEAVAEAHAATAGIHKGDDVLHDGKRWRVEGFWLGWRDMPCVTATRYNQNGELSRLPQRTIRISDVLLVDKAAQEVTS